MLERKSMICTDGKKQREYVNLFLEKWNDFLESVPTNGLPQKIRNELLSNILSSMIGNTMYKVMSQPEIILMLHIAKKYKCKCEEKEQVDNIIHKLKGMIQIYE